MITPQEWMKGRNCGTGEARRPLCEEQSDCGAIMTPRAMEQSAMWTHGSFCWNELMTRDPEQAKRFYADTIGWTFEPMPMPNGTYWVAKMGDTPVAGIFPMSGPDFAGVPEYWIAYIAVDDVDARLNKAVAAGASIMRPPFDVPGVGRIAIMREPGGAVIAWMTPAGA
jgi:predicted enzyme related to lactoylglutathione lyase